MNRAFYAILAGVAALVPGLCQAQVPLGPVLVGGQPQDQTVVAGGSATFSVTPIGTSPFIYQWNRNGVPIPGATASTYTTPPTSGADNGAAFTVTVGNSVNTLKSPSAILTVASAPVTPTIVAQPQSIQVLQGKTATFYVFATGTALKYQWSRYGLPIPGATSSVLTTPSTTLSDNKTQITVTVSNGVGTVTSTPATLFVVQTSVGLGGFSLPPPGFYGSHNDFIGVQFRFNIVENSNPDGKKIIYGLNNLYSPGSSLGYDIATNVFSWRMNYTNGACATSPPAGANVLGEAGLRIATTDYPYQAGKATAVGSSMNTSDGLNWPVQTFLVDNVPKEWGSMSISQFNLNGTEGRVTVQRGSLISDVSAFTRCGLPMLSTTYRQWTVTAEVPGQQIVSTFVAPESAAHYIDPAKAMSFSTELFQQGGVFTVQYWDFNYMAESNPVWTTATTLMTLPTYDGGGQDFGVHVVTVSGQDRVELSSNPCGLYLPGNLVFTIAPPTTAQAAQTITFDALSNVTIGVPPFAITAVASSGLPVSFASTTPTVCTVAGNTVTIVGLGTCSITASQSGSAAYSPASPVTRSLVVNNTPTAPEISPGGIVPANSTVPIIQPGEWVSVFGSNLAPVTANWSGDFPTSLGGTSVKIDGRPAYLSYVSPGQINLQAPDDTFTGVVGVTVMTANGSSTSTVALAQFAPSFLLLDSKHVAGIIARSDGSGAYGGGTYDIIGPPGSSLGYSTVAAKAGDVVELFGTGFGPTTQVVPAGQRFSGAVPASSTVMLTINGRSVNPDFAGLSGAGLYQINFTVPAALGVGDVSLQANVGGTRTPAGVLISLK